MAERLQILLMGILIGIQFFCKVFALLLSSLCSTNGKSLNPRLFIIFLCCYGLDTSGSGGNSSC
jgi:hypothetical protein